MRKLKSLALERGNCKRGYRPLDGNAWNALTITHNKHRPLFFREENWYLTSIGEGFAREFLACKRARTACSERRETTSAMGALAVGKIWDGKTKRQDAENRGKRRRVREKEWAEIVQQV